ncbi:MAG TPA: Ig-like domain-containing protein [Isosphaeraceae bacterium]|jgi:RNA polymerase sigma-70 factor (ECF subfamily)|nr:Ig-like domain-containing protein [Isosphaeraceae bacterium]
MMRAILPAMAIGCFLLSGAARAQEITLDSAPPVVVKAVPEAGASDVDPATAEIRVTFSQPMQDGTWSWATVSNETFPRTTGKPKYMDDRRTAVLPVKLEPGKTYAVWLNSANFQNFKGANGKPAVPYLLVFKTKG